MKKSLLLSTLLLLGLLSTGCVPKTYLPNNTATTMQPIRTTQSMPTPITANTYHQLQTIQGPIVTVGERSNGFTFPQYQGKIILLQIFGKECPYCFEEMPTIRNIHAKYGQGLDVIAIQAQDPMSKNTASRLINQFQMNYPIIERDNASDLLLFMRHTYGWNGILPYTLLIKDGVTEYSFSGQVDQQELDDAVNSLI